MKVFTSINNKLTYDFKEVEHYLGIKIIHENKEYTISTDDHNRLIFRAINNTQLVLIPNAANSIEIKSE